MGEIVRQTINLYNTVGLVDKDKNIYFVPHQSDIYAKVTARRTKVCDCYHELFNTVSPFSSKYQNIDIDQWNPEDRSLVIDGLIDYFRQSRGQGLALNYMIVTRAIYEVNGGRETLVSNYYQAFFIDSVEQAGSRSVRLSVSPDYFTNFFYLNNNDTLTSTYDPFNPVMKNCFIERQHYNRYAYDEDDSRLYFDNLEKILSNEESYSYKYQYKEKRLPLLLGQSTSISSYETFINQIKAITTKAEFKTFVSGLNSSNKKRLAQLFLSYVNIIFKETNVLAPLFYANKVGDNITLKGYRAGFNTYKGVSVPFTHIAIPIVIIPEGFDNIKKDWFMYSIWAKQYSYSTNVSLVVRHQTDELFSSDWLMNYLTQIGATQYILTSFISKYSTLNNNIFDVIVNSTFDAIEFEYSFGIDMHNAQPIAGSGQTLRDNLTLSNRAISLDNNTIGLLPFRKFTSTEGDALKVEGVFEDGYWFEVGSPTTVTYNFKFENGHTSVYLNDIRYRTIREYSDPNAPIYTPNNYHFVVMVLGQSELSDIRFEIPEGLPSISDIKNKYYEPLIEAEPYCFYSISINETEQIISKFKMMPDYDSMYTFECLLSPFISYNESYKVGLVPSYYINGKRNRYYSDALVSVVSSELPVLVDSWITYYINNKAQMKNQFAVQKNNFESGLAQGVVSGVANTGASAIKGAMESGKEGLIAGLVTGGLKTGADVVNNIISNEYQVANIELTQKAKMSDMGAKPDTVKFAGSDALYDINQNERGFYINYYRIDNVSYESICKYLERFGYLVKIFDRINVFDRIGLNYVKITSFDYVEDNFVLSQEQMDAVSEIFANGVTLLHNKDFLHNMGETGYHNYELLIEGVH